MIPVRALASLVLLFAISFGYGAYVEPVSLHYAPLSNVELKQNSSTIQGRVVVQLGRFIVLQRADKSIAAIDMSNVVKISRPEDARRFWRNPAAHMKPNREKIEAEELVKERLPLTKWELTPKEKEDFDRVMRLVFDAASILRCDLELGEDAIGKTLKELADWATN